jgi:predicted O-linked N-acetylglucosamine transferase (SPINDLY family)
MFWSVSIHFIVVLNAVQHNLPHNKPNTICNGPTNALVCNKTLIHISHTKTLKITPTCFDHQMIIIRELFDPG